jgi:hypothetical protein
MTIDEHFRDLENYALNLEYDHPRARPVRCDNCGDWIPAGKAHWQFDDSPAAPVPCWAWCDACVYGLDDEGLSDSLADDPEADHCPDEDEEN